LIIYWRTFGVVKIHGQLILMSDQLPINDLEIVFNDCFPLFLIFL
jgi:hypothetical protein